VKECCLKNKKQSIKELVIKSEKDPITGELCKICHLEENSISNPLLSICHCTGSMRFVHYNCLKTWVNYKLIIKKQEHLNSYCWKSFECEICKTPYDSSIMYCGMEYPLAQIPTPLVDNYIILESSSKGKHYSKSTHVFIPSTNKSEFKIGRGHESDIKVPEISVSRTHAKILMKEEGFALEDNSSKFGTLVLIKDEFKEIDADDGLTIQIGRTLITFYIGQYLELEMQNAELSKTSKREVNNT